MEEKPLVSVIVATYNRAESLLKTVTAYQKQTYKNLEIIVIGDGCTDNTAEVMAQIIKDDVRVYFENLLERKYPQNLTKRQFHCIARIPAVNRALDLAKGRYIAHSDDDDVPVPEKIEIQLKTILQEKVGIVTAQAEMPNGKLQRGECPHSTWFYDFEKYKNLRYNIECYKNKDRRKESADREVWLNYFKKDYFLIKKPLIKRYHPTDRLNNKKFNLAYAQRKTQTSNKLFDSPIFNMQPHLPKFETMVESLNQIYESRWLTNNGKFVIRLEEQLKKRFSVRNVILVNNGTTGLLMVLKKLMKPGKDEIILPSFTFAATPHAVSFLGLNPIFCDINPRTLTIGRQEVEPFISNKTLAILGVHVYGRPCNITSLAKLSKETQIPVVYDAAHCFGCKVNEKSYGSNGKAEIFSFHATKIFSTIEGGAITTNDDDLAKSLREMRNFGFVDIDNVASIGINAKLNEISAAFGLASLSGIEERIAKNKQIAQTYRKHLSKEKGILFPKNIENFEPNYHYFPIFIVEDFKISRDALYNKLRDNNVMVRRYFYPGCHKMAPYQTNKTLETTERAANCVLCLPIFPQLDVENVLSICNFIKEI